MIENRCLINGQFVDDCAKYIDVINPANGEVVSKIPHLTEAQVSAAIENTINAHQIWSKSFTKDRYDFLMRWHKLILENIDDLALIVTMENGKPLADAKSEILYGANFISWFAAEALRIQGVVMNGVRADQEITVKFEPVGPVAAITPWNFPSAMIARKLAPALAAGCAVILKPSELTPLSAFALGKLAMQAGLPAGVLNIVTGDAEQIGNLFCKEPKIRKLTFTGSTRVGKILASKAWMKKLSLELGGNAPFIIFEDVDIDFVVSSLISGKCRSSGQACTSMNRIFVHQDIYEEFIEKILPKFSGLKLGVGTDPESQLGPLINRGAVDRILSLLQDAVAHGAQILSGGSAKGLFLEPTILVNKVIGSRIFKEEIFGPVLSIYKFSSDEEVLEMSNSTEYGLASYIFTNNHKRITYMVDNLDYGIVGVNESLISNEIGAFGGRKDSGIGIEGSIYGIYEFLNYKYICERR